MHNLNTENCFANSTQPMHHVVLCQLVGRSGEDESQEDVLMDEAPSNISQASTLQANREGITHTSECDIGFIFFG